MSSDLQSIGWEGQLTIWIWNFLKMDSKDATSNVIFQVSWKHKKIFFKLPWPKLKENQGLAKPPIPLVYSWACNFFYFAKEIFIFVKPDKELSWQENIVSGNKKNIVTK